MKDGGFVLLSSIAGELVRCLIWKSTLVVVRGNEMRYPGGEKD